MNDYDVSESVLATLQENRSRSVGGGELQATAGATERQIRAAISSLRRQGHLIVGDWHGYYFARNMEEVHACVRELLRQAWAVRDVATAMMRAAENQFIE